MCAMKFFTIGYCDSESPIKLDENTISKLEKLEIPIADIPKESTKFLKYFSLKMKSNIGLSLTFSLPAEFSEAFSIFLDLPTTKALEMDLGHNDDNPFAEKKLLEENLSGFEIIRKISSRLAPCIVTIENDSIVIKQLE